MALSHKQKALERSEVGSSIALAITDAAAELLPDDVEELAVHSHRILQCNHAGNIWHATDLHSATGEAYDGAGRFWRCGSKLCPDCLAKTSRRNRKQLASIIEQQKLNVGEHYHFLTLTMPNHGLPLLQARKIMNYAWTLFRKKEWFRRVIIGGVKSEEFTLTKKGYHYHMHLIVRSKYIAFDSFRHFWSEALRTAFAANGHNLAFATSDGLAIANAQRVRSMSDAIQEVAKYITKASSWAKLRASDLLDVARIERWPRMFEFFGSFRSSSCGVVAPEESDPLNKTILDTESLSDDDSGRGWRRKLRLVGAERYLDHLHDEITSQSQFRMDQLRFHYTAATFFRIRPPIPPDFQRTLNTIKELEWTRDAEARHREGKAMALAAGIIDEYGVFVKSKV